MDRNIVAYKMDKTPKIRWIPKIIITFDNNFGKVWHPMQHFGDEPKKKCALQWQYAQMV